VNDVASPLVSFLDTVRVVEAGTKADTDTDTSALHPTTHLSAHIDDDWGIVYSQGGVVFATMLRAAEQTLNRPELHPATSNATFLRPVRCGAITLTVEVLRSGRNGAQACVTLHDPSDDDPTPNAKATLVCASRDDTFPTFTGIASPFGGESARLTPDGAPRLATDHDGRPTMPFFRRTDWRDVTPSDSFLHKRAWFRFSDEPESPIHGLDPAEPWDFALLPIPADALGMAAGPSATELVGPITSPTLELSLQFVTPARGTWIGIDSQCDSSSGGIISGKTTLWNTDGTLIATAMQTAMLRRLPIT
jgi:acyl-CoA thioesterase